MKFFLVLLMESLRFLKTMDVVKIKYYMSMQTLELLLVFPSWRSHCVESFLQTARSSLARSSIQQTKRTQNEVVEASNQCLLLETSQCSSSWRVAGLEFSVHAFQISDHEPGALSSRQLQDSKGNEILEMMDELRSARSHGDKAVDTDAIRLVECYRRKRGISVQECVSRGARVS